MKEDKLSKIINFFTNELWVFNVSQFNRAKRILFHFAKFIYLMVDSFLSTDLLLRAASLTYTTSLAIVPSLAVAFSVLKGFGFQYRDYLQNALQKFFAFHPDVVNKIIEYVENTNVATLGAVGIVALFFTAISLLTNIERSLNIIWGIKQLKPITQRIPNYITFILLGPFLIISAFTATTIISSHHLVKKILTFSIFGNLYVIFLKIIPYFTICLFLTFIYLFFPNTKVKIFSAFIGGLLAGILYQIIQHIYLRFQISITTYNAIYGGFAQIPLFLFWLYVTWNVILLGCELTFATQTYKSYSKNIDLSLISQTDKEKIALKIIMLIYKNFVENKKLLTTEEIAAETKVSPQITNDILNLLEKTKFILFVEKDGKNFYSPAMLPENLNLFDFFNTIRTFAQIKTPFADKKVERIFENTNRHLLKELKNTTIMDLLKL